MMDDKEFLRKSRMVEAEIKIISQASLVNDFEFEMTNKV